MGSRSSKQARSSLASSRVPLVTAAWPACSAWASSRRCHGMDGRPWASTVGGNALRRSRSSSLVRPSLGRTRARRSRRSRVVARAGVGWGCDRGDRGRGRRRPRARQGLRRGPGRRWRPAQPGDAYAAVAVDARACSPARLPCRRVMWGSVACRTYAAWSNSEPRTPNPEPRLGRDRRCVQGGFGVGEHASCVVGVSEGREGRREGPGQELRVSQGSGGKVEAVLGRRERAVVAVVGAGDVAAAPQVHARRPPSPQCSARGAAAPRWVRAPVRSARWNARLPNRAESRAATSRRPVTVSPHYRRRVRARVPTCRARGGVRREEGIGRRSHVCPRSGPGAGGSAGVTVRGRRPPCRPACPAARRLGRV